MARIRTIKPEFFSSEDIVALSPFARLLYIALWCEADREGRFRWKPATFKLRYLPADDVNAEELCTEILSRGLVVRYGDGMAYIPSFLKHQHINPRESVSTLPDPSEQHASARVRHASARVTDGESTVTDAQVGKERKGRSNTPTPRKRGEVSEFPPGFERFWEVYPRKVNKPGAIKAFARLRADDALVEAIVDAVVRQSASDDWRKDGGQYVPHPATWLNGRRWEDLSQADPDPYGLRKAL